MATIERTYPVPATRVWELWTTPAEIERWWAPDGFVANVQQLDLRVGGELHHSLTAVANEMVAFMEQSGLPLTTHSVKRFTEVVPNERLAYVSAIDFVPGKEPYDHLTVVDFEETGDGTRVAMHVGPMHDEEWTQRLVAGRTNELDNLARLVEPGT